MLEKKSVKLTTPTSIDYFPILADKDMSKDTEGEKKSERQSAKINSIIGSMFDDYTVKTVQTEKTTNYTYRSSSYRSQLVENVKDSAYNEFATMSFDLYAIGLKKNELTPILRLNIESIIGEILFIGLDDLDKPTDNLANYGFFMLTSNDIVGEQQLSFYATKTVPEKIFHCSLQFLVYTTTSDVSTVDAEEQGE